MHNIIYIYICIYASVHLRWRSASGAYANSKGCSTKGCGTTGLFVRIFVSASRHCHAGLKSGSPIRASELSPDTPLSMKIITGGAQQTLAFASFFLSFFLCSRPIPFISAAKLLSKSSRIKSFSLNAYQHACRGPLAVLFAACFIIGGIRFNL